MSVIERISKEVTKQNSKMLFNLLPSIELRQHLKLRVPNCQCDICSTKRNIISMKREKKRLETQFDCYYAHFPIEYYESFNHRIASLSYYIQQAEIKLNELSEKFLSKPI
jgi:hypothetical protein